MDRQIMQQKQIEVAEMWYKTQDDSQIVDRDLKFSLIV